MNNTATNKCSINGLLILVLFALPLNLFANSKSSGDEAYIFDAKNSYQVIGDHTGDKLILKPKGVAVFGPYVATWTRSNGAVYLSNLFNTETRKPFASNVQAKFKGRTAIFAFLELKSGSLMQLPWDGNVSGPVIVFKPAGHVRGQG